MVNGSAPLSEFRLRRRVQFYEADPARIVHFSWFPRYMEEAEHAMWRAAGLSIAPADSEVAFPRIAMHFEFHQPLQFGDEFEVHIRVAAIGRSSLSYTCVVQRDETPVATGRLTIVCVRRGEDGRMRPTPIPDEIRARFAVADAAGVDVAGIDESGVKGAGA